MQNKSLISPSRSSSRSFTLIELIVVIIIVGILAAVGISQYSATVEKSRVAEARARISTLKQLAFEYYLNNGTFVGITNDYVGSDNTCHSTDYYRYTVNSVNDNVMYFIADRCGSGGKSPQGVYYRLWWQLLSNGSLSQYGYQNSGGSWVYTDNWGGCCR